MRRGEILKLKWTDLDKDRGFITLRDPKGGPDQRIPLSNAVSDIFDSITPHPKNPYIFPGRFAGSHLTIIPRESLERIRKSAGLPQGFRPLHGLRHVYASMLASSGQVDLYTLQKLLTHKSPHMTQRYAHLRDLALKKAADLAGSLVKQSAIRPENEKVINLEGDKN
jgi:integrase